MRTSLLLTLLLSLLAATTASQSTAAILEQWQFNEDAGADLSEVTNSGSLGSTWNFGSPAGQDETNGTGAMVFNGDTGTRTRKAPKATGPNGTTGDHYASPLMSGNEYTLSVNFASWSFSPGSAGDNWTYKLVDTAGKDIAKIILEVDSDSSTRLRLATYADDTTGKFRNFAYGLDEPGGALAEIKFDFDDDTVSYFVDGVNTHNFGFGGLDVSQHVMSRGGTWGTTDSSLSVDSISLSVVSAEPPMVPELSAAFTWTVLASLVAAGRRRRGCVSGMND